MHISNKFYTFVEMKDKLNNLSKENLVEMVKCEQCEGDGWRYHESNSAYTRPCYRCNETGLVPKEKESKQK